MSNVKDVGNAVLGALAGAAANALEAGADAALGELEGSIHDVGEHVGRLRMKFGAGPDDEVRRPRRRRR